MGCPIRLSYVQRLHAPRVGLKQLGTTFFAALNQMIHQLGWELAIFAQNFYDCFIKNIRTMPNKHNLLAVFEKLLFFKSSKNKIL